ncbi:MAG: hypothetical protein AAGJ94_08420 [Pseudomonadota bacterium]
MLIDDFISASAGGSPNSVRLFWWQGWSSRYYLTSIFDLKNLDCRESGTFIVVRREPSGERTPLFVGTAHSISDDLYDDYGDLTLRAIRAGANEIHVSFTAETVDRRHDMGQDLADGWSLKHQRQPVPA